MSLTRLIEALFWLIVLVALAIWSANQAFGQSKRHRHRRPKPVAEVPDTTGVFIKLNGVWVRSNRPNDVPGRITNFDDRQPVNRNLEP